MYKDNSSFFPGLGGGFFPRWSWLSSDDSDGDAFERMLSGLTFPEDDLQKGVYREWIVENIFNSKSSSLCKAKFAGGPEDESS